MDGGRWTMDGGWWMVDCCHCPAASRPLCLVPLHNWPANSTTDYGVEC